MNIRVAIADDHQLVVSALKSLLSAEPGITIIGTAYDGAGLLDLVRNQKPDIVLIDIAMPGMNGIETVQRLTAMHCASRIIVLSGFSDKRFVLEAMNAGAHGYVVKSSAADELARAIGAVARGDTYLCPAVAGTIVEAMREQISSAGKIDSKPITPRERIIVRLLAEGRTSAQIARELHIAPSTADTHRRNIMRKLDVHNLAEVTRYAIREGIVQN